MNYIASARSTLGSHIYDVVSQDVAKYFWFVVFISFWGNILMLTPTLYMLQVFDRFLISKNVFTLVTVTLICCGLYLFLFFAEWLRSKVIIRAGIGIDEALNRKIFRAAFAQSVSSQVKNPAQAFSDLSQVRQFVTGNGAIALTDVPWIPVYVLIAFFLHPILGATVLVFVASLFAMTWVYRKYLEGDEVARVQANIDAGNYLQLKLRNAEAISAHGMLSRLTARWEALYDRQIDANFAYHERLETFRSILKVIQYAQQSLTLAVGALLVIDDRLTVGAMIAANVIVSRACQPIQLAVQSWSEGSQAWGAYGRLKSLLESFPEREEREAQQLSGVITLKNLEAWAEPGPKVILDGISLEFRPGTISMIVGPSGSGKSTLLRNILGIWPERRGLIEFDGSDVAELSSETFRQFVGYLPQDIELFPGTVADNIAAFGTLDPEKIVEAARLAEVHDLVLRLPKGYETEAGQAGQYLSGGQRQRLAIARAIYNSPKILVMDEPNASLDDVGEAALLRTVNSLRERGSTVIIVAHRGTIMAAANRLIVMQAGKVAGIKEVNLAAPSAAQAGE